MRRILDFFLGNTVRLLFWFYMLVAVLLSVGNHRYLTASYLNSSSQISGGFHSFFNGIESFFKLRSENEFLQQQNKILQENLANSPFVAPSTTSLDIEVFRKTADSASAPLKKSFSYIPGVVIKNSYTALDNYLTLSLGTNDSVFQDMGVVNEKGIIGIVTHSGSRFSRVQSILNTESRINAKIKGSDFFGGLIWNGKSPNRVQLIDVPNLAPISKGDTILTGGMSSIFPDQLPIGTIEEFTLTAAQDYYVIEVQLFNDMQNIGKVYAIKNHLKNAIQSIQNQSNE